MAGRALRPVRTMGLRARGISERNLHERLALDGPNDELRELRRHIRRAARATGVGVRVAAPVRGQRLARATDADHGRAHAGRGGAGRSRCDRRLASRHLRARARGERAGGAADRGAADARPRPAGPAGARGDRPGGDRRPRPAGSFRLRCADRIRLEPGENRGRLGSGRAPGREPRRERAPLQRPVRLDADVDGASRRQGDAAGHEQRPGEFRRTARRR